MTKKKKKKKSSTESVKKKYGRTFSVYTTGESDAIYHQCDDLQNWLGLRSRSDVVHHAVAHFYNAVKTERAALLRMKRAGREKK